MTRAPARALTPAERADLSPGLIRALEAAGAAPRIAALPHPAALVSALWRRHVPILTLGQTIHWPDAPADLSAAPETMAVLQHELHHVLEFATGVITPLGYLMSPLNWTYEVTLTDASRWWDFGAEQRAVLAERLWWADHGFGAGERLRELVPWA